MSFSGYIDMLLRNGNVSVRAERADSFERECTTRNIKFLRIRTISRGDGSPKSYIYVKGSSRPQYGGLYAF